MRTIFAILCCLLTQAFAGENPKKSALNPFAKSFLPRQRADHIVYYDPACVAPKTNELTAASYNEMPPQQYPSYDPNISGYGCNNIFPLNTWGSDTILTTAARRTPYIEPLTTLQSPTPKRYLPGARLHWDQFDLQSERKITSKPSSYKQTEKKKPRQRQLRLKNPIHINDSLISGWIIDEKISRLCIPAQKAKEIGIMANGMHFNTLLETQLGGVYAVESFASDIRIDLPKRRPITFKHFRIYVVQDASDGVLLEPPFQPILGKNLIDGLKSRGYEIDQECQIVRHGKRH